jgi:hypothetical protein
MAVFVSSPVTLRAYPITAKVNPAGFCSVWIELGGDDG